MLAIDIHDAAWSHGSVSCFLKVFEGLSSWIVMIYTTLLVVLVLALQSGVLLDCR